MRKNGKDSRYKRRKRSETTEGRKHKETEIKEKNFLSLDFRFKNNKEEWMCVVLKDSCDLCENYRLIQVEVEEVFGEEARYFIPVHIERVGNKNVGVELHDGYIYVKKSERSNNLPFNRKMECLDCILPELHERKRITNRTINNLKTQLIHKLKERIPRKGDRIVAVEGTFKNLEGNVISVNENNKEATVEFKKKTRIVESVLSVVNFEIIRRKRKK